MNRSVNSDSSGGSRPHVVGGALALLCACSAPVDAGENGFGNEGDGEDDGTADEDGGSDDDGADSGGSDSGSGSDDSDDGVRYDVGSPDVPETDEGCEKVDFLFVVDRSSSMWEKQELLVQNFPGFIQTIQSTLEAQDYHILVTDTDGPSMNCYEQCESTPTLQSCQNTPCGQHPEPGTCDATIGAGLTKDQMLTECGVEGGLRYMLDTQTDLEGTFGCLANVGTGGDVWETQAQSVIDAVGPDLNAPMACNDGFVREDAILVVTLITDEDDEVSMGTAADWKQALLDAKGGNEDSIIMLGLLADAGTPNAVCEPFGQNAPLGGSGEGPNLRDLVDSLSGGIWASVCEPDYSPFFLDAVDDIDTACDNFVPPG